MSKYKDEKRWESNKMKKLESHIKKHPEDKQALTKLKKASISFNKRKPVQKRKDRHKHYQLKSTKEAQVYSSRALYDQLKELIDEGLLKTKQYN